MEDVQGLFEMVHANTFKPKPTPVNAELGELGVVGTPAPETKLQLPVPMAGTFAAKVAELTQTV